MRSREILFHVKFDFLIKLDTPTVRLWDLNNGVNKFEGQKNLICII